MFSVPSYYTHSNNLFFSEILSPTYPWLYVIHRYSLKLVIQLLVTIWQRNVQVPSMTISRCGFSSRIQRGWPDSAGCCRAAEVFPSRDNWLSESNQIRNERREWNGVGLPTLQVNHFKCNLYILRMEERRNRILYSLENRERDWVSFNQCKSL